MVKFLIHFHRILGTILSVMFLAWFLSGMVMMYHHFPNISNKEYKQQTALPDSLPDIAALRASILQTESIRSLSVGMFREKPVFNVETDENNYRFSADSLLMPIADGVPFAEAEAYARRWNTASIIRVDTLHRLDQWIPTAQYKEHLPIYKFRFADKEKSYLYISSVNGTGVQHVTREQRIWSWLGPIPHFLYFWQLRQNRESWISVVSWIAGIGALMCLAGIVLGIRSYWMVWRKKRHFRTPYKRFYFKWHHILGFFFGFFVLMFVFSGMMSLNDLPQWVVKTHDTTIEKKIRKQSDIDLAAFTDYRLLLKKYSGKVKEIEFKQYGDKPYFAVVVDSKTENIDATTEELKSLYLSKSDVLKRISDISQSSKSISLMNEFDNYYVGFTQRMQLPVYKVTVADADGSVFYVNPKNGSTRYYNKNQRVGKWIYPAFHSLRFKFFAENQLLRDIVLWVLLIGGTGVSFTGVVLGYRYIRRLLRKKS